MHYSRHKIMSPLDDSFSSELDSDNEYYRKAFGSASNNRLRENHNSSDEAIPLTAFPEDNTDVTAVFTHKSPSVSM